MNHCRVDCCHISRKREETNGRYRRQMPEISSSRLNCVSSISWSIKRTTRMERIFSINSRNFLLMGLLFVLCFVYVSSQQLPVQQVSADGSGNNGEYFQMQPQATPYFVRAGEPGPLLQCAATPKYAQDTRYQMGWVKILKEWPVVISRGSENYFPNKYKLDAGSSCHGCYHLQLLNVSFAEDNGRFFCQLTGPNSFLIQAPAQVVVLARPGPPSINFQVSGPLREGQLAKLECQSIGGNPPPRIAWKFGNNTDVTAFSRITRNTTDPSSPTISLIEWPVTYRENNQNIRCFVWNEAMGDNTAPMETESARFVVLYPPKVTVGPSNPYSAEDQKDVSLTCTADANPPARSYAWSYQPSDTGSPASTHSSSNQQNLTFQVTRQNRGIYTCTATSESGNGQDSLHLDVQYAPRITFVTGNNISSSMVLVSENQGISVTCQPDANPPATSIAWAGPNGQTISENAVLNLHSVSRDAAGNYTCTARNTLSLYGSGSTPRQGSGILEVKVKHAPGRAIISESEPAVVGGTVNLSCTADDLGAPAAQYQWKAPGQQDYEIVPRAVYTIENVQLDRAGEYSCRPFNEVGLGQATSYRLIIYQPAQLEDHLKPEDQKKEADPYELFCSARGHPAPNITWYKDDEPISLSSSSDHWQASSKIESSVGACADPSSASAQDQCSYKVVSSLKWMDGIRWTDKGYISCRAYNGAGRPAESKTLLRIQHKPVIVNDPSRPFVAAELGQEAVIECKASANPEPLFRWTKGGQQGDLTASDSSASRSGGKQYSMYQLKTNQSYDLYEQSLKIRQIEEDDFGEYQCRAHNQLGEGSFVFKLIRKKKPESPESFQGTSEKTHLSVVLSWVPGFDGGYDQTFSIWQLESDQIRNVTEAEATSNTHLWRLRRHVGIEQAARAKFNYTGLLPAYTYSFKIKAWNQLGETGWSDKISAMTSDAPLDQEITKPEKPVYNADTNVLEVRPTLDPGKYCVLIYLRQSSGTWETWNCVRPDSEVQGVPRATNMRVRFCNLQTMACGEPTEVMTGVGAGVPAPIIVAICVAAVVFLALAAVICFCCFRSRRQKQGQQASGRNFLGGANGSDKNKDQQPKNQKKQKKTAAVANVLSRNGTAKKDYEMETNQARPKAISGPYLTKNTPGPIAGLGVDQNTGSSKDSGVFTTSSATNAYDPNSRNGNAYVPEPTPIGNGHGPYNGSVGHHHHGQQMTNGNGPMMLNRPPSYDGHEHWGATDGYGLTNNGVGAYMNGSNHHHHPHQQQMALANRGSNDFHDGTAMEVMNGQLGPGAYYDGTTPTSALNSTAQSSFVDPYGAAGFVDMNPNGGGSHSGSGAGGGDGSMNSGYSTPTQRRIMREIIV